MPEHSFYLEVPRSFIEDNFNLYGLRGAVEDFLRCIDIMLDRREGEEEEEEDVARLYLLIHARWILTNDGMNVM